MSNLTAGATINSFGQGGRKINLPVKATTQLYMSGMAAQVAGACAPATAAGAGDVIGVFEHDMLGGASDGTTRVTVVTDKVFVMTAGTAAPTDATPYGTPLFCEDDNSVGTGSLGANNGLAGYFVGIEDDGRVRVFIGSMAAFTASGAVNGTALTDTATTTIQRVGRFSRYLLAGTMSQGETVTLGTTGAVKGDVLKIVRTSVSAQTLAVVNGGAGAGTLCTLVASKIGFAQAYFDGTNWLYDGCSAT